MSDVEPTCGTRRRRHHRSRSRRNKGHRRRHRGEELRGGSENQPTVSGSQPGWPPPPSDNAGVWQGYLPPAGFHRGQRGSTPPEGWHGSSGLAQPASGHHEPSLVGVSPFGPPSQPMADGGVYPGSAPMAQSHSYPGHIGNCDPHRGVVGGCCTGGDCRSGPSPTMAPLGLHSAEPRYDEQSKWSPFSAVPPPPSMSNCSGSGGVWRGRGGGCTMGSFDSSEFVRPGLPEGVIVTGLPPELASMGILNRHFREFGEVLRIAVQGTEGRAFVQFAGRSAMEAALAAPPIHGRSEIVVTRASWATSKGGSGGKGCKGGWTNENRVLVCDTAERKRQQECRQQQEELHTRKANLLGSLTDQLKMILGRLRDPGISDGKRTALKGLLQQIKSKMDDLSLPHLPANGPAYGAGPGWNPTSETDEIERRSRSRSGGSPRLAALPEYAGQGGEVTLDVTLPAPWPQERLRDELLKFGASADQLKEVAWKVGSDGQPSLDQAVVRFEEHRFAQALFDRRSELPFSIEWPRSVPSVEPKEDDIAVKVDATIPAPGDSEVGPSTDVENKGLDAASPEATSVTDIGVKSAVLEEKGGSSTSDMMDVSAPAPPEPVPAAALVTVAPAPEVGVGGTIGSDAVAPAVAVVAAAVSVHPDAVTSGCTTDLNESSDAIQTDSVAKPVAVPATGEAGAVSGEGNGNVAAGGVSWGVDLSEEEEDTTAA